MGVDTSLSLKEPNVSMDLDKSKKPVSTDLEDLDMLYINSLPDFISLKEGMAAHENGNMMKAWRCFNAHADLGNPTAKYWKGCYLWEGYTDKKDRTEALRLFKEAADDGVSDAQLQYAISLIGHPEFDGRVFIEYLEKAADNKNTTAQFDLGDLYIHGKFGIARDKSLGRKYLESAAEAGHSKAIEALQKFS